MMIVRPSSRTVIGVMKMTDDASEESDEVHSTVPMKLQFFDAADASVCLRKPFLIVHVQ